MNKQPTLIRDAFDFGPPPPKPRETPWEKLYRFFFGDDVFISYARADATRYVPSLAARLAAKGHICFFDQLAADPNEELPERLKRKILRSTVFVLVGTKGAVASSFVHKEIELFRRTRRPFIPVDVDGALAGREGWGAVIGVAKIHEQGARVRDGDPSPEVVNLIKDSFRYTRRSQWLRASLLAGVSFILVTVALSLFVIRAARAEAAAIRLRADSEVAAANSRVGEAQRDLQEIAAESNRLKADADDARKQAESAATAAHAAVAQLRTAEQAMYRAQELERQSAERAADTARREAGSRSELLSREPGMEFDALALAFDAAEQSVAHGGRLPDEVLDGVVASAMAADYSLPLEALGKWRTIDALVISPDGEKIVAGLPDYSAQTRLTKLVLWDGRTGKIASETQTDLSIYTLSFSRDGKRLAALTFSERGAGLAVWDLSGPRMILAATDCGRGIDAEHSIALDNDGSHVIIGRPPRKPPSYVTICEIATGREEVLPGLEDTLSVAFTPEGEPVAYGTTIDPGETPSALRPFLYFPRSGRGVMLKLPAAGAPVPRFMSFANDGSVVLTVIDARTPGQSRIYVQSLDGNVRRFGGYRGVVVSAAYVDSQARAVTLSGRSMRVVDGRSLPNFAALRGHIRGVEVGEFSPDGRTILTVSDDGKGRLWDAQTGRLRHTLAITDEYLVEGPLVQNRPKRAAFRADGKRLVTVNDKGEVQTWDVDTGRLICSAPGPKVGIDHPGIVFFYPDDVSFLTGGDYVLAAYSGSFISFLDAGTCRLAGTFNFDEQVAFLALSRDGTTMTATPVARTTAAASESPKMQSWSLRGIDLQSGAPIRLSSSGPSEPPGPMHSLSPDGALMLISAVNTLQVWRRGEASPVLLEKVEVDSRFGIQSAAFSADGTRVAVISGREAWVWDTRSGKLLVALKDDVQANWDRLMSLSPDGSRMLIACKDYTVRIYPTSRQALLGAAGHLLGR